MVRLQAMLSVCALLAPAFCDYRITLTPSSGLLISKGTATVVNNSAILSGPLNTTVSPLKNSTSGLTYNFITPTVAKVTLNASAAFSGARFSTSSASRFYGVWEYPFQNRIDNKNVSYELKGLADNVGINWSNARAPFFMSSDGYGVYADTLKMGGFDFTTPGEAKFVFNSSSLVYYIILPQEGEGLKSVIEQYTGLSSRSEMPPTSGLGPTFWSDDFEQDFHGGAKNAQENIQDMVDHLYYNRIRATATFADRPYGTGPRGWGNFDFDPKQYPDPAAFIRNLTDYGFAFQVWITNRAQPDTKIMNASTKNDWLFPSTAPVGGLGPALNLSIPAAYAFYKDGLAYFPSVGVRGYKIDRGEEGEMPDYVQNEQMALFLRVAYETMVSKWGASGFYTFARSAVDRSRAHTHIWNGDSRADYTGLAYSVASGIRSGLIAFGIWGSDTGGYLRADGLTPSPDVWMRWMWFSAFSPVYELMLGTGHTPWYPPYTNTSTLDVLRQTANLHADLTPYIRSYAHETSASGVPIMRALFLEAPNDNAAWDSSDQYFFGAQLLVAPIVTASNSRTVRFPTGPSKKYLDYLHRDAVYAAGSTANVTAGLDSIPVFVVQGAIVPRGDVFQGNAKWIPDWKPHLRIELFPSFDVPVSRFTLFEGEGQDGHEVPIVMRVDADRRSASVAVGAIATDAVTVVWYVKGNETGREMAVPKGGGVVELRNVEPLF